MPGVVVLGGDSTGEHLGGVLRHIDPGVETTLAGAETTLVVSAFVGGERSHLALQELSR